MGRISRVQIESDGNIEITLPEKKGISSTSLSQGTSDILYLSLRLALLDFIQIGKNLPIILDDSLVHLDSMRQKRAFEFLKTSGESRQIFYLTTSEIWKEYGREVYFL
jgi:uncharacterized protein YhaN